MIVSSAGGKNPAFLQDAANRTLNIFSGDLKRVFFGGGVLSVEFKINKDVKMEKRRHFFFTRRKQRSKIGGLLTSAEVTCSDALIWNRSWTHHPARCQPAAAAASAASSGGSEKPDARRVKYK